MRIAIVDNDEIELKHYRTLIEEYEKETKCINEVFYFDNGYDFLEKYPGNIDCIFMDIDMPSFNGLEVSQKLRELDNDVILIFVTNLPQFAIEGYKVQALDFLLKPFRFIDLKVELEKVKRFISKKGQHNSQSVGGVMD